MSSLFLCSVSILMLICTLTLAAQNFVNVTDCPKDTNEWEIRSKMKNCYGDTPDYLCAPIENMLGQYGEICTIGSWIPEHECVVLNKQTHNLDSVDCKADTGCPSKTYLSSEVWRYKICFENFYGITKTLADKTTPAIIIVDARNGSLIEDGSEDSGSGTLVGVVVAVVIILIIVVVVMVVLYVRNQFGFKDKVQHRITDFRKYFEHGDENTADAENGEAQSTQVPLLEEDVRHVQENETNSEKVTNTSNTGGIKEEGQEEKSTFSAKPEKTKTKKEKVTNTSNTGGVKEEGQKDVRRVQENKTNSEKVTNTSNTGGIKEEGQEEKSTFSAKPEKTKTKKEKVTNTSNTGGVKEEGQKGK
nr:uncharacterized protein LOC105341280 isoform X9 [Crassostrea gigas]